MCLLRQLLFCVVCACVWQCVLGSSIANSKLITRLVHSNVNIRRHQPSQLYLVRNYLNSLQKSNIYNKRTKTNPKQETGVINHHHFSNSADETRTLTGVPEAVLAAPVQGNHARTRGSRTPPAAAGIHIDTSHRPTHPSTATTVKTLVTEAQVDLAKRKELPDAQVDLAGRQELPVAQVDLAGRQEVPDAQVDLAGRQELPVAQVDLAGRQEVPDAQVDLAGRQEVPDAQVDLAGRQEVPVAQVDLAGRQELPDAQVDIVKRQDVPDGQVDLVKRQELPEAQVDVTRKGLESLTTVLPAPLSHELMMNYDEEMGGEDEVDFLQGTAPPYVCDLCPTTVDNKNPLSPCKCVGNSGSLAGEISITCPATTATTEQLHDLFTHTDFLTNKVFRFTLQGSNVTGVLSQDLWGDLVFTQVLITSNKFTQVDNKAFNNSANTLTLLNLDNNQITYYVTSGVDDLPKLTTLVLKRNRIPIVFTNAFNYSSLRVLDLSSNLIDTIGKNAFAELNKLEELHLQRNLLTRIDDDCFRFFNHIPFTNFLIIDLSYNKISYISEYAFRGLRNVQINLQYNLLTTISEKVFHPIILDSLYFVYFTFEGNNIVCDCKIMWVVEDSAVMSCFDNFMCVNMDAPVYSLEPADLGNCSSNAHH
nr:uncharacterized protein LOC123763932 [Procambarus clarkii]